jgi:arylsulfatase A-like enzyme
MSRVLRASGYHCASIGKIHLVPQGIEQEIVDASRRPDGTLDYYGFGEVDLVNGHGDRNIGTGYLKRLHERVPDFEERRKRRATYDRGVRPTRPYPFPLEAHSTTYIADRTVEFLERPVDAPFFLHVSFPDPHHPFTVPEPYASMYRPGDMPPPSPPYNDEAAPTPIHREAYWRRYSEFAGRHRDRIIGTPPDDFSAYSIKDWQQSKAIYCGMVSLIDDAMGRIMGALERNGLRQNTIVVFLSDHGDYMGDHGLLGKGFHYDCVVRTPLIVSGPGARASQRVGAVSSAVDIAPTLLDMVGVEEPQSTQGVSMREILHRGGSPPRRAALTENDDDMGRIRARTITTDEWKLTIYANESFGELYDRRGDPQEAVNRWDDPGHADTKARLTAMLLEEVMCSFDTSNARRQEPAPPVWKWKPHHR